MSGGEQEQSVRADFMARQFYRGVSKRDVRRITHKLIDAVERALDEIDTVVLTTTVKSKVIEYGLEAKPDKPTKEILTEIEEIEKVKCIVDRGGLKQITGVLKEIKDIGLFSSELDLLEQEARIENILSQIDSRLNGGDEENSACGVVVMPLRDMNGGEGGE